MRIKCVDNTISSIPSEIRGCYCDWVPLILGKSYIVYAVIEDKGFMWFCIYDELNSSPMWHPRLFFEIEDHRLSKYWIFNFRKDPENIKHFFSGFPEWANNEYYYNELFGGERETYNIFHKYEKLMNVEFPDPAVVEKAQIGDEEWLMCPLCIDAWKSNTQDALVTCPKCKKVLNNPRYKNELPSYK